MAFILCVESLAEGRCREEEGARVKRQKRRRTKIASKGRKMDEKKLSAWNAS